MHCAANVIVGESENTQLEKILDDTAATDVVVEWKNIWMTLLSDSAKATQ